MRRSRSGYVMAMMAGLAIVGASTGGVVLASAHHDHTVAAASVTPNTSDATTVGIVAPSTAETPIPADPTPVSSPTPVKPAPAGAAPVSSPVASPGAPVATVAPTTGSAAGPTTAGAAKAPITTAPIKTAPTTTAPTTTAKAPPAPALEFKDGKYSATGSYHSPGGIEKLGVTVTITADKVSKSDLDLQGGAGLSHSFQSAFEAGYSSQVIGKRIGSISLGAVSGSSLTGMGFNDALKQIESAARLQK